MINIIDESECKISLNRRRHTKRELLECLKKFNKEHGRVPTRKEFDSIPEYPCSTTYINHFGSWKNALELIGLCYKRKTYERRILNRVIVDKRKRKKKKFFLRSKTCRRCGRKIKINPSQRHHIIPRKYGGPYIKENLIDLCYKCHDYVEIKTDEYIKSGMHFNVDIIRCMIVNDGFSEYRCY